MSFKKCVWSAATFAFLLTGCATNTEKSAGNADAGGTKAGVATPQNMPEQKPQGTANFTSHKAGFSIYFPAKPTENITTQTSESGQHEQMIFQSETEPVTYIVLAISTPPSVDTSDADSFLDGIEKGLLEEAKAKVLKRRSFQLQGMPSRELQTSMMNGQAMSRVYICLKPRVTYQIMAVGLKNDIERQHKQIDKVFRSFRTIG